MPSGYRQTPKTGTIKLPNVACLALWDNELTGQFSDGLWENSGPRGHWQFWSHLEASVASVDEECKVTASTYCDKNNYGLTRLIEFVGERMVALGRMAIAASKLSPAPSIGYEQRIAAENMPNNYECFLHLADARMRAAVSDELAAMFYATTTTYTERDLRKDLKRISTVMKTVSKY